MQIFYKNYHYLHWFFFIFFMWGILLPLLVISYFIFLELAKGQKVKIWGMVKFLLEKIFPHIMDSYRKKRISHRPLLVCFRVGGWNPTPLPFGTAGSNMLWVIGLSWTKIYCIKITWTNFFGIFVFEFHFNCRHEPGKVISTTTC